MGSRGTLTVRTYFVVAVVVGVAMVGRVSSLRAQPDPFAAGSGSAGGSAGAGTASGSAPMPPASDPAPAEPTPPSPACEHITKQICTAQDSGLLLKSAAYVVIAVLLFSLIRVWWDKRGTSTAGIRFVATLLPAAVGAGALAYLDPTRGQDLKCCLASAIFKNEILFQDSALARGAVLGLLPAAALFVIVAIALKVLRG
jgi:hypothetical protein